DAPDVDPDIVSYNIAINAHARLKSWKMALALFKDLKAAQLKPTQATFANLITAAGIGKEWHIAAGLFGQMRRSGLATVVGYNALLTAYARAGETSRCLPLLRRMQDENLCAPNTVTFNALLTAYWRQNNTSPEEVMEIWWRLVRSGCMPNNLTYDSFAMACASLGDESQECSGFFWRGPCLTGWMRVVQGVVVVAVVVECMDDETTSAYVRGLARNTLMCIYDRQGQSEEVIMLYARLDREGWLEEGARGREEVQPARTTYNARLGVCEARGDWRKAQKVLKTMRGKGCKPDHITFNLLISLCEEAGQWDQATEWLETAMKQGMYKCCSSDFAELDLHNVRSAGTAQTILRWWLRQLRNISLVDKHQRLPMQLQVITGWGKHSSVTGHSPVKERVIFLLDTLDSPFSVPSTNKGCLLAEGAVVNKWLVADELLSLMRFLSGNGSEWRRNFAPRKSSSVNNGTFTGNKRTA
ncbi:hypothetical protein CYMTET_14846, partial [Cymbomonas tetramitiformis]